MCFDYDESPEFSDVRIVRARKPHRCSSCRGEISAGEDYERQTGKFDGHFYVDKLCRRCCYDRNRIVEHELAEGCHWSESWPATPDIAEYLSESGLGRTPVDDVPAGFKVGDEPAIPVRT